MINLKKKLDNHMSTIADKQNDAGAYEHRKGKCEHRLFNKSCPSDHKERKQEKKRKKALMSQ
jgi:hypothetical protein